MAIEMEYKQMGGTVSQAIEETRNGVPVGLVSGHFAAWSIDEPDMFGERDKLSQNAFDATLAEHRARGSRQIRFQDEHHGELIGGVPLETVHTDSVGLFGTGELNLRVPAGAKRFALAQQGVLVDFSIGFSPVQHQMEGPIRHLEAIDLWHVILADEPRNRDAQVTDVKSLVPFQDLPLAPQDTPWHTSGTLADHGNKAFVWRNQQVSGGAVPQRIRIAEMVDGQLKAVPRGIFAAAEELKDAQSGVYIPQEDRPGVIRHIERYYVKMGLDSPFDDEEKAFFRAADVEEWGPREMERALKSTGAFSGKGAMAMVARLKRVDSEVKAGKADMSNLLKRIEETQAILS